MMWEKVERLGMGAKARENKIEQVRKRMDVPLREGFGKGGVILGQKTQIRGEVKRQERRERREPIKV